MLARVRAQAAPVRPLVTALLVLMALTTAVDLLYFFTICRYYGDFAPWWALAAGITWLLLAPKRLSWGARAVVAVLCAWSALFVLLYTVSMYRTVETHNKRLYAALAAFFDAPVDGVARMLGAPTGPVALTVRFANPAPGARCALIEAGSEGARDRLEVEVPARGQARFTFYHDGVAPLTSRTVSWPSETPRQVTVSAGFLFPSESSGRYATRADMLTHARRLYVAIDHETVIDAHQRFHPASPFCSRGRAPRTTDGITVESIASAPEPPPFDIPAFSGELRTRVRFVRPSSHDTEPFVERGATGRADVFFVRWLAADTIAFGLDHGGKPPLLGPALTITPDQPTNVTLTIGAADDGMQRIEVRVNDQVAWSCQTRLYDAEPEDFALGVDRVGSTVVSPRFTGTIERLP